MSGIPSVHRIIGIDPGFGRMGWGVIEKRNGEWTHLAHGCIETAAGEPFLHRLNELHNELKEILTRFTPGMAGVEELFFYNNAKTATNVGQARGVILLTLFQEGVQVREYTPLEVKQAVVGYGRAEKGQIQKMVAVQLGMKDHSIQDDAADALAVALTCAAMTRMEKSLFV